jgi:hypothetical protein
MWIRPQGRLVVDRIPSPSIGPASVVDVPQGAGTVLTTSPDRPCGGTEGEASGCPPACQWISTPDTACRGTSPTRAWSKVHLARPAVLERAMTDLARGFAKAVRGSALVLRRASSCSRRAGEGERTDRPGGYRLGTRRLRAKGQDRSAGVGSSWSFQPFFLRRCRPPCRFSRQCLGFLSERGGLGPLSGQVALCPTA